MPKRKTTSLNLDRNSGLGVGNLDTELLRACNNINSLSRRNGVGNPAYLSVLWSLGILWENVLGSEGLVVHKEKVNITDVVDEEGLVSGWHHVAGLLVGSKTNLIISSALILVLLNQRFVAPRKSRHISCRLPSPP